MGNYKVRIEQVAEKPLKDQMAENNLTRSCSRNTLIKQIATSFKNTSNGKTLKEHVVDNFNRTSGETT